MKQKLEKQLGLYNKIAVETHIISKSNGDYQRKTLKHTAAAHGHVHCRPMKTGSVCDLLKV